MKPITDREEFVKICKTYRLEYGKNKVKIPYSNKRIWVMHVIKCPFETEQRMKLDRYYLKYIDGCFYPYIYKKEKGEK